MLIGHLGIFQFPCQGGSSNFSILKAQLVYSFQLKKQLFPLEKCFELPDNVP